MATTPWCSAGSGSTAAISATSIRVDGTTLAFQELHPDGARPPARAGAALIEDPGNGRLLLSGGTANRGAFDDIWQLALP